MTFAPRPRLWLAAWGRLSLVPARQSITTLAVVVIGGAAALALSRGFTGDPIFPVSDEKKVQVSAVIGSECPSDQPLAITVRNESSRPVKSVAYGLAIHLRGDSADVLASPTLPPPWTRIVEPMSSASQCVGFTLTRQAKLSELVPEITFAAVTLYQEGERVPR